ncbi:tripartite tricarboxylate transporter TctB family protein [Microvirga roseola]|uniref:tripartite tricarboxylate transporter TctB family protein n=1 Tax=Microvirga roseola TaxID=2883126 RepID=UPI001E3FA9B8|nr:tripartite tricarboxylate transporter TctB family protein [Microvirga roseola]
MRIVDITSALVMLAVSAGVYIATRHLPYWADFAPGPAFAPFWISAAGAVLSLILLVGALRRQASPAGDWPDRSGAFRVILAAVGLWTVVILAPLIGLLPVATLFMLFLLIIVERRSILPSLLTVAVTMGLVYGVFSAWLGIAFPKGMLGI